VLKLRPGDAGTSSTAAEGVSTPAEPDLAESGECRGLAGRGTTSTCPTRCHGMAARAKAEEPNLDRTLRAMRRAAPAEPKATSRSRHRRH